MLWLSAWLKLSKERTVMSKRGVPSADQKAPKPSFYSKALDEAEQLELHEAAGVEGLDYEIALLRFKLRELLEEYPEKVELQLKAANALARLVHTRYKISAEQKKNLREAIALVLRDVAIPLGLKFLP
jgi:hypothetical protein